MSALPNWVHRTPQLFYFLAALMGIWSFLIGVFDINAAMTIDTTEVYVRVAYLRALHGSVQESAYYLGTGVTIHVLLALWGRSSMFSKPEAAE
jgi:hypothetical protein